MMNTLTLPVTLSRLQKTTNPCIIYYLLSSNDYTGVDSFKRTPNPGVSSNSEGEEAACFHIHSSFSFSIDEMTTRQNLLAACLEASLGSGSILFGGLDWTGSYDIIFQAQRVTNLPT